MKQTFTTQELTKMALLTTMICISAYIVIPLPFTPVTLTAQTLVVNLICPAFNPGQAVFSIVIYLLLGLIGLPVFSGGMGGPAKLFGPTGGYLLAYLVAVALMSWLKGKRYHFIRYSAVTILVGMPDHLSFRKYLHENPDRHGLGRASSPPPSCRSSRLISLSASLPR